jgi:uncharacterized protein YegP (UPF0339 family)
MRRKIKAFLWLDYYKEWRFRVEVGNGRTIAVSKKGYKRKINCLKALWQLSRIEEFISINPKTSK